VRKVNERLREDCALLDEKSYGDNWVCVIEGDGLDAELPQLKIGNSAISLFQEDIERFLKFVGKGQEEKDIDPASLYVGAIGKMDDSHWDGAVREFFGR